MTLTKDQIRTTISLKLQTQNKQYREKKSALIMRKLFAAREFKQAKIVMFYVSLANEVNTEEMIKQALMLGKMVVVPVCAAGSDLCACALQPKARLLKGPYGIKEPAEKKPLDPAAIDLVIVPGLAFTRSGKRLGRGKGYYDRFLKRLSDHAATIGLAFDFQILPSLPTTPLDVDVHRVLYA